ncbi:hypothetical protein M758_2G178100 [Ceratodon purpureus]|nr:hypothetical protein M758_2G178100 [Ceratodon purpureus]
MSNQTPSPHLPNVQSSIPSNPAAPSSTNRSPKPETERRPTGNQKLTKTAPQATNKPLQNPQTSNALPRPLLHDPHLHDCHITPVLHTSPAKLRRRSPRSSRNTPPSNPTLHPFS